MTIAQATANRILALCKEREITINRLSIMSGVTQSTVNDIINGETKNPGISTIKKLCDGLEISIQEFFNSELFCDLEQELR